MSFREFVAMFVSIFYQKADLGGIAGLGEWSDKGAESNGSVFRGLI